MPETVLAMLQARTGLLAPRARRLLRVASVFGETFPLSGVLALLGADDASEIEPVLSALARDEVLEADDPGRERWRFRHALLRDAAYSLLTSDDRDAARAAAARFLQAAAEDPAVVAQHFERAGDRDGAVRHFTLAALRAYRGNDLAGAIALVQRGVDAGRVKPSVYDRVNFIDDDSNSDTPALNDDGDPTQNAPLTINLLKHELGISFDW